MASTQSELDKLKQENERLVSSYKATGCVCVSTSLNIHYYKSLQDEFEKFKKDHYKELRNCKLSFPILKIILEKWIKERVILITYFVCKRKLTFLRKPSLHPPKRWTQIESPKRSVSLDLWPVMCLEQPLSKYHSESFSFRHTYKTKSIREKWCPIEVGSNGVSFHS